MALTILAVDDSVTMRKILEITFAGSDFQPILASSGAEAVEKLQAGGISLVICDNSLDGDGYEVARQLKAAAPGVPLLFLSSRQNPYDAGKGSAARVDNHIDKPFDTTQMLDRVGKLASGGVGVSAAPAAAAPTQSAAPAPIAAPAPAPAGGGGFGSSSAKGKTMAYGGSPQPAAPAPKAAGFGAGGFGGSSKPAPAPSPAPAPVAAKPAPAAAPARPAAAAVITAATSAANGQLAAKMGELGLTPQQADAVLAISRDLLERVVWEVVPTLAETLIKEEILRLMK